MTGPVADDAVVSAAALHPLLVAASRRQRTLRLDRPDYRTGVEWSTIAVLSLVALSVWLYAAVELAIGLLNGA